MSTKTAPRSWSRTFRSDVRLRSGYRFQGNLGEIGWGAKGRSVNS